MIASVVASLFLVGSCLINAPVDGPIIRPFQPVGAYGGHWGVDLAVPMRTPVRPILPGVVTFSGEVAGRASITVSHGGGLRSSYSYLTDRLVGVGQRVDRPTIIGTSGVDHGVAALHLSLRVAGSYVDPARACRVLIPADALRLSA